MKKITLVSTLLLATSCAISIDDWVDEGNYTHYESSEPAGDETSLEAFIDFGVGELAIQAGDTSQLYQLDAKYNQDAFEPQLDLSREGDVARLRFELSGGGKLSKRIGQNRLDLRLNPDVPLRLTARTGVTETEIDLSGLAVEGLDLQAGVGETTVSMLSANRTGCGSVKVENGVGALNLTGLGNLNFEAFRFTGGVGAAILDFSGDWEREGSVSIQVGVGGVEVLLPRDLGVELRVSKSFLSGINVTGFRKQDEVYYSDNLEQSSCHGTNSPAFPCNEKYGAGRRGYGNSCQYNGQDQIIFNVPFTATRGSQQGDKKYAAGNEDKTDHCVSQAD
jgi:hypothetical protein